MKLASQFRAATAVLAWVVVAAALAAGTACEKRGDKQQPAPAAGGTPTTAPTSGAGGGTAAVAKVEPPSAKKPDGSPYRIAFVTNNTSDFWKIAKAGVKKYEAEGKVQVDVKMPTDGKTPAEQNQILNDLSTQGYDAIAVSVIAPDAQADLLNRVGERTKLITFDSDSPKSSRLLYVGTKNYEAGKQLGGEIVRLLPSGGKVAVFVGTFSADNARERLKGIEDAIKGKNIEIIDRREDQTDREKARSNVEAVINARSDLNLVVGLWSYNGPAIAAALEGTGKKGQVKAAVFDEEAGTLAGIEAGTIDVTVVQRPFEMGYQSAKWMHELAARPDAPTAKIPGEKAVDTGVEVVNKGNVAAFKAKLKELTK
ncbi:MAG TPA: sugar-binding protein [Humisphaera sp.]